MLQTKCNHTDAAVITSFFLYTHFTHSQLHLITVFTDVVQSITAMGLGSAGTINMLRVSLRSQLAIFIPDLSNEASLAITHGLISCIFVMIHVCGRCVCK